MSLLKDNQKEQLIQLVKDRPFIWNPHHPEYQNSDLRSEVWSEIDLMMDPTGRIDSKCEWKRLRLCLANIKCKYRRKNRSVHPNEQETQWKFLSAMSFLRDTEDTVKRRRARIAAKKRAMERAESAEGVDEHSTADVDDQSDYQPQQDIPPAEGKTTADNSNATTTQASTTRKTTATTSKVQRNRGYHVSSSSAQRSIKRSARPNASQIANRCFGWTQPPPPPTRQRLQLHKDDSFGNYVAQQLKELPAYQKELAFLEITRLIRDARIKVLERNRAAEQQQQQQHQSGRNKINIKTEPGREEVIPVHIYSTELQQNFD